MGCETRAMCGGGGAREKWSLEFWWGTILRRDFVSHGASLSPPPPFRCAQTRYSQPALATILKPYLKLEETVRRKALLRLSYVQALEQSVTLRRMFTCVSCVVVFGRRVSVLRCVCRYDNLETCPELVNADSPWHNRRGDYAMHRYMYYRCFRCKVPTLSARFPAFPHPLSWWVTVPLAWLFLGRCLQEPYFGGERACGVLEVEGFSEKDLMCASCVGAVSGGTGNVTVCPKHGADFIEYKCRFCCSTAVSGGCVWLWGKCVSIVAADSALIRNATPAPPLVRPVLAPLLRSNSSIRLCAGLFLLGHNPLLHPVPQQSRSHGGARAFEKAATLSCWAPGYVRGCAPGDEGIRGFPFTDTVCLFARVLFCVNDPTAGTSLKTSCPCPLKVKHAPTGQEYSLGCGVCNNIASF